MSTLQDISKQIEETKKNSSDINQIPESLREAACRVAGSTGVP